MHKLLLGCVLLTMAFAVHAGSPLIFRVIIPNSRAETDLLKTFLQKGGKLDDYIAPPDTEFITVGKDYVLVSKRQITVTKVMEVSPRERVEQDYASDKNGNQKVKNQRVIRTIGVRLYPKDGMKFEDFTARHIGYQLLIMLDGNVISAPTINQKFSSELSITVGSKARFQKLLTTLKTIEVIP